MIGDSLTTATMQKALDGVWQRQKSIANNIANYETPGYKSIKVSFEKSLEQEVRRHQGQISSPLENERQIDAIMKSQISYYSDSSSEERADGNNVNLENENIEMAKTQIQYQYLTRGMSDMFSRLRYAISEGRK